MTQADTYSIMASHEFLTKGITMIKLDFKNYEKITKPMYTLLFEDNSFDEELYDTAEEAAKNDYLGTGKVVKIEFVADNE